MIEMAETKSKDTPTERYGVGEIATQTSLTPIDNNDQKAIDQLELLVRMANDIEKIKNSIVSN